MKTIQKYKLKINKGKQEQKTEVGSPRPVVDSVAEELIRKGLLESSKEELEKIKGVKVIEIWEEVEEGNVFDLKTAKKDELLKFAEENEVDLGEASKVDEIREAIKQYLESKED